MESSFLLSGIAKNAEISSALLLLNNFKHLLLFERIKYKNHTARLMGSQQPCDCDQIDLGKARKTLPIEELNKKAFQVSDRDLFVSR
jgi:hypothetical protein